MEDKEPHVRRYKKWSERTLGENITTVIVATAIVLLATYVGALFVVCLFWVLEHL